VDKYIQEEILDAILKMQQKNKKTIIFISHNMKETLKIADRIAILKDGALEQEGTLEQILQNPETKNIIGEITYNL
jgi:ABC-type proline/glycine betaine transport system ATPase subunit